MAPLTRTLLSNVPVPLMSLDVKQTDDAYIIRVEIPGVDKDNLHVEIDDSMHAVTITSEVVSLPRL
jgi:HSP20 family molecular chaperone IbpA